MKRVLILTTSTGQGHNQAANSLQNVLTDSNYQCVKFDFLGSNSKFLNSICVKGYEISATHLPKIYGIIYKITDNKISNKLLEFIFSFTIKKLSKVINSVKPDLIIGTHPFTAILIRKLKKQGLNTPFISVITDFKAHFAYINNYVDSYITGSEYTKHSLIERGIDKNIIYPIGIPIKYKFYSHDSDIASIKTSSYLNILLMSGSMEIGRAHV